MTAVVGVAGRTGIGRHPWVRLVAELVVWVLVTGTVAAYLLQGPPGSGGRLLVGNVTLAAAMLYACLRTARLARRRGPARRAWVVMAVALGFATLGQVLFASSLLRGAEPAASPVTDLLSYVGYCIPLLVAVFLFPRPPERLVSRFRNVLDAVVITTGVVLVSERTVLGTLRQSLDLTSVGGLATLFYPLVDVALCAVVLTLGMRQPPEWRLTWLFIGTGLVTFAVTDSVYVRLLAEGATGLTGTPLVVGWVAAPVLIGVGTLVPVDPTHGRHWNLDLVAQLVPYVPVLAAAVVLAVQPVQTDPVLVVGGLVLLVSVAVRQVMIVWENLVLTRDLERKVAERTAQLATLGSIVTSSRDAVLGFALDRGVTAWNPAAEALFGHPAAEVLGRPADFLPEASLRRIDRLLLAASRGEELGSYEIEWTRPDGTTVPVALTVSPVHDEGVVSGISFVGSDITERRRAAEVLEQAREDALQSARVKSEFLATMSHEIRTPMNGVIGLVALLMGTDLDERQRDYLQGVQHAGQALLDVINDILDFSKLEAGKLVLDSVDVDVRRLVEEVGDLLAPAAYAKGLTLGVEVDPATAEVVRGDHVRLRQVLLNLASNAVKFTAEGSVQVRVGSRPLAEEDGSGGRVVLRVDVVDTGIGVAEADQPRLFESFAQADASTTRRYGGTGLGLAISKQLVEAMDGEIGVVSLPGAGSTFWFEVPLPVAERRLAPVPPEPVALGAGDVPDEESVPGIRGLVLVVEDNELNQLVARGLVERLGFATDLALDGVEALEALARRTYDVVLMDCHMPGMDGFAATRSIREREGAGPRTPVVALTASALATDRERCLAAGMDDYLPKPVDPVVLAEVLDRWAPGTTADQARPPTAAEPPRTLTEASAEPAVGPIDPEQIEGLAGLRTPDGGSLLSTFISSFARRADNRLDTIRDCVGRADDEALAMAAHELKGSAATIGAVRVASLCAELEHGGSGVVGLHPGMLDDLAAELALAVHELDAIAARAA